MKRLQSASDLGARLLGLPPVTSPLLGLLTAQTAFAIIFLALAKLVASLSTRASGAEAESLPPVNAAVVAWVLAGLALPVLLFGAADRAMGDTGSECWLWRLLGERVTMPENHATEPPRKGYFLQRPYCAHSSHAQIAAGCFIFAQVQLGDRSTNGTVRSAWASLLLAAALLAAGLASYAWWGARRQRALRADHVMMETQCWALVVMFLSVAHPSAEPMICALGCVWVMLSVVANTKIDFRNLVAMCCAAIWGAWSCGGTGQMMLLVCGVLSIVAALLGKMADSRRSWMLGTACLHYMAALSFVLLYLWSQTLPMLHHRAEEQQQD